jgi:hypothetical protein
MPPTALQHPMDLPWAPLAQRHTQPTALRRSPCYLHLGWQRLAVIKHNSTSQTLEVVLRHDPIYMH